MGRILDTGGTPQELFAAEESKQDHMRELQQIAPNENQFII